MKAYWVANYTEIKNDRKLDKDRFRKDLGNIIEAYQEVARRLGIAPEQSNITEVKSGKPRTINFRRK